MIRDRTSRGRMTRRRMLAVVAGLVAVVVLSACAQYPADPDWVPRAREGATVELVVASPESASPASSIPTPTGLDVRRIQGAADSSITAEWAEIPGNDAFNGVLVDRVRSAAAEHAQATGVGFSPGTLPVAGAPPGATTLAVTFEIVAAAGTVLAEQVRVTRSTDGVVTSDETTVYFADTTGAFVMTSDAFLTDSGLRALLKQIVESVKIDRGAFEPSMQQSVEDFPVNQLRADFSDITFANGGSMQVRLPAGFTTPELDRLAPSPGDRTSTTVVVPSGAAFAMLTEHGRVIQDALGAGQPLSLPAASFRGDRPVDCALFSCVALTFDDGPGPYTDGVLDALNARRSAATFFVVGSSAVRRPSVVRRMHAEGHGVENHTWSHPSLTSLTPAGVVDQIQRTSGALSNLTGERVAYFRPPYGDIDAEVSAAAVLPAILWSVDTLDWQKPGDAVLLERAVQRVSPGGIILCHDVHESTARMVPAIVDGLIARGFTLVTVEQLLASHPPGPGAVVSRAG